MVEITADPLSALIRDVASKVETARAKINLTLHITGRRADGYHLLDSLVGFADLGDTLRAVPREEPVVKVAADGPFADQLSDAQHGEPDLIERAADALIREYAKRVARGFTIHLTKELPVAAGLGGGSADAAAALRLLDRLWRLDAGPERLGQIGLRLGA